MMAYWLVATVLGEDEVAGEVVVVGVDGGGVVVLAAEGVDLVLGFEGGVPFVDLAQEGVFGRGVLHGEQLHKAVAAWQGVGLLAGLEGEGVAPAPREVGAVEVDGLADPGVKVGVGPFGGAGDGVADEGAEFG